MAFYGRVTNEAKTSMTFDRVFPNRVTMDATASSDGIFTGRFVLVEYSTPDEALISTYQNTTYDDNDNPIYDETEVYQANYQKDQQEYKKLGRGYDSTVWRKVIADDGSGYYVMLAELNSVVPTFTISAEAPGDSLDAPIQPHFDEDSTNVVYNLHMGAPWAFRIKDAKQNIAQSDGTENLTDAKDDIAPKAIYINKDGLNSTIAWDDKEQRNSSERINKIEVLPTGKSGHEYAYHYIDNGEEKIGRGARVDTQEMVIQLPVIGDTVATLWDGIYGDYQAWNNWYLKHAPEEIPSDDDNNDENETPKIKNLNRKTDVLNFNWGDMSDAARYDGLRLISKDNSGNLVYTPEQINNLTGALHTLYDAIGQNLDRETLSGLDLDALTKAEIAELLNKEYAAEETPSNDDRLMAAIQQKAKETDDYGIYYCPNNNTFYFKNYETYVKALDPVQDAAIIQQGSKLEQVTGTIKSDNVILYKKPTATAEAYIKVGDDERLQPNVTYYQLNLGEFTSANEVTTTIQDLNALIAENKLVKIETTQSKDTLNFLAEKPANLTNVKIIEEGPEAQEVCAYFPSGNNAPHPFVDYANRQIDTYPEFDSNNPTIDSAKKNILYQRIRDDVSPRIDDQGQIISDEVVYTTVLKAVAITNTLNAYLAQDNDFKQRLQDEGYLIEGLKPIYKWPNTTKNITGVWYKDANDRYTMSVFPPNPTSTTPDGQIAEILTGIATYKFKFTNVTNIYEPNKFWKTNKDKSEIWLNTKDSNDSINPTYYFFGNIANDLALLVTDSAPGVNGLDEAGLNTDSAYQAYFIPKQLYTEDGSVAEKFNPTIATNHGYYKYRSVVVLSDPLGEFNEGELWNTELKLLDINSAPGRENKPVMLGVKLAKPHLYELKGYSRDINTINGWILALNRMIGNEGDKETRDRNTIIGTINYLNDKLDKIENIGSNQLIVSNVYGHINGAELNNATPNWIEATITHSDANSKVTLAHKTNTFAANQENQNIFGAQLVGNEVKFIFPTIDEAGHVIGATDPEASGSDETATKFTLPFGYKVIAGDSGTATATTVADTVSLVGDNWLSTTASEKTVIISHDNAQTVTVVASTSTLSFGDTFAITKLGFDEKGHKGGESTHSITLPSLVVNDTSPNGANVITAIGFTNGTAAAINTTRSNIGTLLLTGYNIADNGAVETAITANDSLNVAIERLEYRLNKEISDRENTIQALDATVSQSAGTDGLTLQAVQVDGVLTGISGSIAENTYDVYGAANTVLGTNEDTYEDNTVFGAKAYADHQIENISINYTEDGTESSMSLSELLTYVKQLEARIAALEPTPVEPVVNTYHVTYVYNGENLPADVLATLPTDSTDYNNNDVITPIAPSSTEIEADGVTWTFDGWDKASDTINSADITFTGTWSNNIEEPSGE